MIACSSAWSRRQPMRPKPLLSRGDDLVRPRLDAIINARHPLVQLAGLIDWARFDAAFGSLYAEIGRPGLPTRLMVGLHLLKHMKGLSDEEVCAQWVENPYMQAFCGEAVFRHVLPLDRSSLTRWEIGRASCRERVEISGGGVSLKKKKERGESGAWERERQNRARTEAESGRGAGE